MYWKDAVLLVAGKGERLAPHTKTKPKPLTEVNGVPLLKNAIVNLKSVGVERVHLVTGHLCDVLMDAVKSWKFDIEIDEIFSATFAQTNNMYSLWLAREILRQGCFVVEGDVFFGPDFLPKLDLQYSETSYWFADVFTENLEGCMLTTNDGSRISKLEIIRRQHPENYENKYKSAGILSVTPEYGRKLTQWLSDDIEKGRTDVYFDLVVADHLAEAELHVLNIHGCSWIEIDDERDLRIASQMSF